MSFVMLMPRERRPLECMVCAGVQAETGIMGSPADTVAALMTHLQ